MTTNQTIDGVRRELLDLCYRALNGGDNQLTGMEHGKAFRELRALLDAYDALHAQPADATHYYPKVSGSRKWRKLVDGAWCEWCGGAWLLLDHAMVDDYVPVAPLADGSEPCAKSQVEPAVQLQGGPIIAGDVLDSYDHAIADLDPESACTYLSNGELAQMVAAVRTLQVRYLTQPEPDSVLCGFYSVTDYPGLVRELVGHVEQLQESAKRNVKPWEDTFPPMLLPAYIERVNAANAAAQFQGEPVGFLHRHFRDDQERQIGAIAWEQESLFSIPVYLGAPPASVATNDSGNVYPARNPEDDE